MVGSFSERSYPMRAFLLGAAISLSVAAAASAQPVPGSSAALQAPVASPIRVFIDGVAWRCAGQACVAIGEPRSQATLRACRRVAAQLGAVTAFTYAGRPLSADQVPACNTEARPGGPVVRAR